VVADSPDVSFGPDTCSICECDFSFENEGGVSGFIGIIGVSFCPTCHAGLHDLYLSWYGEDDNDEVGDKNGN